MNTAQAQLGAVLAAGGPELATLLERLAPTHRFVTVPELLRLGRPVYAHHYHRLPAELHQRMTSLV